MVHNKKSDFLVFLFTLVFPFVLMTGLVQRIVKAEQQIRERADNSSLVFEGSCVGSCDETKATVCNRGDEEMSGSTSYEVWYSQSGNPKNGSMVTSGTISPLAVNQCISLTYDPSGIEGNYMFKAYQRPGHPGTGQLWSEQCSVSSCQEVSKEPLKLTFMCIDYEFGNYWRVRNPNSTEVSFTWDIYKTLHSGNGIALADKDTFFYTDPTWGNTLRLFWDDKSTVKAAGTNACRVPPAVEREPLSGEFACYDDEQDVDSWKISNPNHIKIDFKWEVRDQGGAYLTDPDCSGNLSVEAQNNVSFTTPGKCTDSDNYTLWVTYKIDDVEKPSLLVVGDKAKLCKVKESSAPTSTPTPTPTPSGEATPTPSPGATPTPSPSATPEFTPTPSSTPTPSGEVLGEAAAAGGAEFNPLIEGIKQGKVLGAAVMPVTGAEESFEDLPTNSVATDEVITINKMGLNHEVYEAQDVSGAYLVGDLEVARILKNSGGVVLYGHNTQEVFGKLTLMKIGDTVQYGTDGAQKTYKLGYTRYLSETNTTPLEEDRGGDTLTLITCAPWNESVRIVLDFELVQ